MQNRENVMVATTIMIVQGSIGLSLMGAALCLQFVRLREKLTRFSLTSRNDRSFVLLFVMTICAAACYSLQTSMYANNWIGNEAGCNLTGQPFLPFLFVISKQALYLFLYERASVVQDSLMRHRTLFLYSRYAVAGAIIIGIPAAFYWVFFLVFSSKVLLPEGVCVLFAQQTGPIIGFACMDVILSSSLLFLFAYPLYDHLKAVPAQDRTLAQKKIVKVLKRNLIRSGLITSSTSGNLIAMSILLSIFSINVARDLEFWDIYAMHFPSWDLMFSCSLALTMSTAWLPDNITQRLKRKPVFGIEPDLAGPNTKPTSKQSSKLDAANTKDEPQQVNTVVPFSSPVTSES